MLSMDLLLRWIDLRRILKVIVVGLYMVVYAECLTTTVVTYESFSNTIQALIAVYEAVQPMITYHSPGNALKL